jgi:hypothetical protein
MHSGHAERQNSRETGAVRQPALYLTGRLGD